MAHSQLNKSMRTSLIALALFAITATANDTGSDSSSVTTAQTAAPIEAEQVEVPAPRWNAIATADVPFYKKNFLDKLETVYTKSSNVAMVSPNKLRVVIQHTSKPFKGNFVKEREALGKYILNAIVIPNKGESLDLRMVTSGKHGELMDIVVGDKKYEGHYYAYHHMDTRMTSLTCIAYVRANGRINAYFAQAVLTEFSNCKGELMDLFTSMDLWKTNEVVVDKK